MSEDDEKAIGESAVSVPFVRNSVPFVQNDDSSHMIAVHAQRQRWRMNPALYMNNQPPLPLAALSGKVRYVDFGFTSAREYWTEVAEPAYERFVKDESRGNAIAACVLLWPLHDWLWHEQHPGQDTRDNSKEYEQFRQGILAHCPELAWIRDVADAGKHRGLGRGNVQVREVAKTWPQNAQPLTILLDSGAEHNIIDALFRIITYFREAHFPR
jgi:hypothetical protein